MSNSTVPAAATRLYNANIIPFPQPPCDDFQPIMVDLKRLMITPEKAGLLRLAATLLGLERDELKRRVSKTDPEAQAMFRWSLGAWKRIGRAHRRADRPSSPKLTVSSKRYSRR
jgi:hypothetical protein